MKQDAERIARLFGESHEVVPAKVARAPGICSTPGAERHRSGCNLRLVAPA
jgi:hypothetical protein